MSKKPEGIIEPGNTRCELVSGEDISHFEGELKTFLESLGMMEKREKACKDVLEFINYDVSPFLVEQLEKEGNVKIRHQENRNKIQEMIDFLENKKSQITSTLNKVGETPELKEALELIDSEIDKKEKELQELELLEGMINSLLMAEKELL